MPELTVNREEAASATFITHHGVDQPRAGEQVRLGDPFASGAFGTLHPVDLVAGKPPRTAIVAKVFAADQLPKDGGAAVIAHATVDLHDALDRGDDRAWPDAMLALPYCLFSANVAGQRTIVALMIDLRARGYTPAPFKERATLRAYCGRPQQDRIDIAVRLSERLRLLEDIEFVHGDLNSDNLLVNLDVGDVQIIDFDSGVVMKTGKERPRTPGKPDDCMPPEVKGTGVGPLFFLDAFTPEAERWSSGSLIGYCLLGFHPGFFLRAISQHVVDGYAGSPASWPEIDVHGPLFTDGTKNRKAYPRLREECLKLPAEVQRTFTTFFDAGTDGHRRPNAAQWRDALDVLTNPPRVECFEPTEATVFQGMVVELKWETVGAQHVEITGLGKQPVTGSVRVAVDSSTAFELRATNAYGTTPEWTKVRVLEIPQLSFVPVPTAPLLHFHAEIPVVGLTGAAQGDWLPLLSDTLSSPVDASVDAVRPAPVQMALGFADSTATPLNGVPPLSLFDVLDGSTSADVRSLVDAIPRAPDVAFLLHPPLPGKNDPPTKGPST